MLSTIVIILLVLLIVGAFPSWGYSAGWGPAPASLLGIVLLVVIVFMLLGHRF